MENKAKAIDEAIRRGKGESAREELQKCLKKKVPRDMAATYGNLAARCGLAEAGAMLLHPFVRPSTRRTVTASDAERAEYAHCLLKLGANEEALELLEGVDVDAYPPALFLRGYAHMTHWDYEAAAPLLSRYVKLPKLARYPRLIGMTNLAAVLVYLGDSRRASYLLRELVHETGQRGLHLLQGNAFELAAYHNLMQGKFRAARQFLGQAARLLEKTRVLDAFFITKWNAVLELRENENEAPLIAVRAEAASRRHWETVRECDRFLAVERDDDALLDKIYYGTPYPAYRRRLLADAKRKKPPGAQFLWFPGDTGPTTAILDLRAGQIEGTKHSLPPGKTLHRLLGALASDFYRPFRLASLYRRIYPDEFYNPETSPDRVQQAVRLLRGWLEETGLPLEVVHENGAYGLRTSGIAAIRVGEEGSASKVDLQLETLRAKWPSGPFSGTEAAAALGIPYRTAHRWLTRAVEEGRLVRTGRAAATRYHFDSDAAKSSRVP